MVPITHVAAVYRWRARAKKKPRWSGGALKRKASGGWGWGICLPLASSMHRPESLFLTVPSKNFHSLREILGTPRGAGHSYPGLISDIVGETNRNVGGSQ